MSIQKLAKQLEKEINDHLEMLSVHGKAYKATIKRIEDMQREQEEHLAKMKEIAKVLEPVESLIEAQYPQYKELFDSMREGI